MKVNVLISVFAIALLQSASLRAQDKQSDYKRMNRAVVSVKKLNLKSLKVETLPVWANRKRDLINSQVNAKIKCSIDLFTVVNDKAVC